MAVIPEGICILGGAWQARDEKNVWVTRNWVSGLVSR